MSPTQDVRPVTEFRAHASAFLLQVRSTKHPLILTQHGRCTAVLLDIAVYEDLIGELSFLREHRAAERRATAAPLPLARVLPS